MNIGIVKTKSFLELRRSDGTKCEYQEWSNNLKKFVGKQLAKCVTECKAQATQAKRQIARCIDECKDQASAARNAVNRIKKKRCKKVGHISSLSASQDDSDNEWDTDFEEEEDGDDDDDREYTNYQVNNDTDSSGVPPHQDSGFDNDTSDTSSSSPGTFRSNWSIDQSGSRQQTNGSDDIVLQKMTTIASEDQPVRNRFPKPPNTMLKVEQSAKFAIPRRQMPHAPIQRPPSQPPPPPSPDKTGSDEEYYEIPNTGIPSSYRAPKPPQVLPTAVPLKTQHSEDIDDTYEIMDVTEETYEAVDETESITMETRAKLAAVLPPLPIKSLGSPAPALPSKPKQILQLSTERRQSGVSLVEKLAKDLDEKLRGKRFPIQTPTCTIRVVEKKVDSQDENSLNSVNNSQEVADDQITNPGAVRKTPPPIHVVKPIQQRMSTPDVGRLLTNRPLPPVPSEDAFKPTSNQDNLTFLPFFHEIERNDAEILIGKMASDGSFLIRPSKRAGEHNPYTITMMHTGLIFHINIRRRKDGLYALGREKPQEQTFCDITTLVMYHKSYPIVLTLKGELSGRQFLRETPPK